MRVKVVGESVQRERERERDGKCVQREERRSVL